MYVGWCDCDCVCVCVGDRGWGRGLGIIVDALLCLPISRYYDIHKT